MMRARGLWSCVGRPVAAVVAVTGLLLCGGVEVARAGGSLDETSWSFMVGPDVGEVWLQFNGDVPAGGVTLGCDRQEGDPVALGEDLPEGDVWHTGVVASEGEVCDVQIDPQLYPDVVSDGYWSAGGVVATGSPGLVGEALTAAGGVAEVYAETLIPVVLVIVALGVGLGLLVKAGRRIKGSL
jgi:hypothetical protein